MTTTSTNLAVMDSIHFRIVIDLLMKRGLIDYADIQEAISEARKQIPERFYTEYVARTLNTLEQTYQPGGYQSPIPRLDEPNR